MTTLAAPAPAAPVRTGAAVRQLVAIEVVRLVRHPIVLAGALLSVVFAITFARENQLGGDYFVLTGPTALPLAFATLVAANLAALRSERSDTGELYGSLAAPAQARTVAHLLSVAGPTALGAALVATGSIVYGAWDGIVVADGGRTAVPSWFELAQGPAAVALLGSVGVALARWLPYLPVAPVVGVGVLAAEVPFALWNLQRDYVWFAPVVNPARTGSDATWPCFEEQTWACFLDGFATTEVGWHLAYLGGLALVAAALALLRDERRPRYAVVAAAALAVTVGAGIAQLP